MAHDDVLDLLRRHVRTLERGLDGDAAQIGGVQGGKSSAELADRRARGAEDHGSRHTGHAIAMRVRATTDSPPDTGADTIAVGVFEGEKIAHDVDGLLQGLVDSGEARAGLRKLAVTHAGGHRYVLVGLGKRDEFDAE